MYVQFDGTDFHGWQFQPALRTVQGELQAQASKMLAHPVTVTASSRTDAGVHARAMPVQLSTTRKLDSYGLVKGLNGLLPRDIGILSAERVSPTYNVRYQSVAKTYTYRYLVGFGRRALADRFAWYVRRRSLDLAAMRVASRHFLGHYDFSCLRSSHCGAATTMRTIHSITVSEPSDEGEIALVVTGNAFLRNMIRILAGTLYQVGAGSMEASAMPEIIRSRDRRLAGQTAPARGLTLTTVHFEGYPRLGKPSAYAPPDLIEAPA